MKILYFWGKKKKKRKKKVNLTKKGPLNINELMTLRKDFAGSKIDERQAEFSSILFLFFILFLYSRRFLEKKI